LEIDMKKRLFGIFPLLFGLAQASDLVGITPDELQAMQAQGALVVDVRTTEEWKATGMIPGSKGLTYFDSTGGYDKAGWLKQITPWVDASGQSVILVCRSGNRSSARPAAN
jgi:rhodanese-related sulfurtransferase